MTKSLPVKQVQPDFIARIARVSDLEGCLPIIHDGFLHDSSTRKELLSLWATLLKMDACMSCVVEDRARPKGTRIVGFGINFYGTDGFTRELRTSLPPFLSLRVIEKWKKGEIPFLDKSGITRAVSGDGLSAVVLQYGLQMNGYGPEDFARICMLMPQNFTDFHLQRGYWLKEIFNEVYGPEGKALLENMGSKLIRDYREFPSELRVAGATVSNHPYLMVSTASEVQLSMHQAAVFQKPLQPKFHFRPGEKAVLWRAIQGESDQETAETLEISLWTVKKRWQGIYAKVEKVDSEILSSTPGDGDQAGSQRPNQWRRRQLLGYLRSHPEELKSD